MLIAEGSRGVIRFARWSGARASISDWNRLDYKVRNKFQVRFQALCEHGSLPQPEQMRHLDAGIWEFKTKRPAWRISAFREGGTWFVTHIFRKPSGKKRLSNEINKAKKARGEHLESHDA
ncbi:MAG: type II toxin-antitoxin system RelE/ParE family toxin [Planctomycetes bacterium]|nr:type II toxin-antitoxin system RelE/ParE family toxin [Planctomycetota bacterium]